jgi:hypothetical protein
MECPLSIGHLVWVVRPDIREQQSKHDGMFDELPVTFIDIAIDPDGRHLIGCEGSIMQLTAHVGADPL